MKKNLGIILLALVIGLVVGIYLPSKDDSLSLNKTEIEDIINKNLVRSDDRAEVVDISSIGSISKIDLSLKGQEDSLFVTNDGNVYFQKIVDLNEIKKVEEEAKKANTVKNKSDKPEVELFVMSYCPYGTQMEKGYLPVIKALGDKINSNIKFVNYVMHGEKELKENVLQYCIQKEKPDLFNDYLTCFLDKGDSSNCLEKTKISNSELKSCISNTMDKFEIQKYFDDKNSYLSGRFPLFKIHDDLNKKYDVQGSPSLVVNGQKIDRAGRSPQEVLDIICSGFNEKPEECNKKLSTETYQPNFGYDVKGSNNTASADCGA